MVSTLDQTRRLVESYAASQAIVSAALIRILLALWRTYPEGEWGNLDLRRAWAAESAVQADVALAQTRRLARSYMTTRLDMLETPRYRLPDILDSYERGGVPIVEVYERPAREVDWIERGVKKKTKPIGDGVEKSVIQTAESIIEERVREIVETDVQLTARDEFNRILASSTNVIGYRRIIHPERSKTGVCGLCIVAADRLYSVDELEDIHVNCKCTVDPVTAELDPGLELNKADLEEIYNAAGGTDRSKLSQIRIKTVEHGELGPMLLNSGGKWVDPATVNRRTTRQGAKATPYKRGTVATTQKNWRAMKETSERSIRYLRNAKSRGSDLVDLGTGRPQRVKDIDAAIQYHLDLIARAARHAA